MDKLEAEQYLEINYEKLNELFFNQYGDLPVGGFINPSVEGVINDTIIFHCHYDGFDNEEDSWEYGFDVKKEQFYAY